MPDQLQVRLVTPERILVETTADAVELPSRSGYLEVLFGHTPLQVLTILLLPAVAATLTYAMMAAASAYDDLGVESSVPETVA